MYIQYNNSFYYLIVRYNNLSLIGDCQTLVFLLVELCGWKEEFQGLLNQYCRDHQLWNGFQWSEQYSFERVEENMNAFLNELQVTRGNQNGCDDDDDDELNRIQKRIFRLLSEVDQPEDQPEEEEEDNDNDNDSKDNNTLRYRELKRLPLLRECILRDDGRTVEQFTASARYIHQANIYFLMMIAQGEISNFLTGRENKSELVYLRVGNALLMLNEPNSRCYREMMKWKYSCMFSVCY